MSLNGKDSVVSVVKQNLQRQNLLQLQEVIKNDKKMQKQLEPV